MKKFCGRGGANFKGDPAATAERYEKAKAFIAAGDLTKKDACKRVGISLTWFDKIRKQKGDASLVRPGVPPNFY